MELIFNKEFKLLVYSVGVSRGLPVCEKFSQSVLLDRDAQINLIRLAELHKVEGALYRGLKTLGIELQTDLGNGLRRAIAAKQIMRDKIVDDAVELLRTFSSHGYKAMVIKGPAISQTLYKNPTLREFIDLDILVETKDLRSVVALMSNSGYELEGKISGEKLPKEVRKYFGLSHHATFWKLGRQTRVEIHDANGWEREKFSRDDIFGLFERSHIIGVNSRKFRCPSTLDHGVLIISHGIHHMWCQLHWLLDAAVFFSSLHPADAKLFVAKVRSLGMSAQVSTTMEIVKNLFPIKVSQALDSLNIADPFSPKAVRFSLKMLRTAGIQANKLENLFRYTFEYSLPLATSVKNRVKLLINPFLLTERDTAMLNFPTFLVPLHFLLRPFFVIVRRIFRKYGIIGKNV